MSDSEMQFGRIAQSATILLVGMAIELGIAFVGKVLLANVLGKYQYGQVSVGLTILVTVAPLVLVGLHKGTARFLPRDDDISSRRGVLVSAFSIVLPLSVVTGVGLYFLSESIAVRIFHDPSTTPVIRIFSLIVPLFAVIKLSMSGMQGLKQTLPKVYVEKISFPVLRFLSIAGALALGYTAVGVSWGIFIAYAATTALALFVLVWKGPLFSDRSPTLVHRELLKFSTPLMFGTVLSLTFSQMDIFMIGYFSGVGEVGLYNVVYPLGELLTVVSSSFAFMIVPVLSELHSQRKPSEIKQVYKTITKWIFFINLPIFLLFVFTPSLLIRLFGTEYLGGTLSLSILAAGFFSHSIAGLNIEALEATGYTKVILYINGVVLVVNFALNLLLIPNWGYLGAAVASALSYSGQNLMNGIALYRYNGINPLSRPMIHLGTLITLLAGGVYALSAVIIPNHLVGRLIGYAVIVLLYPLLVLKSGGVGQRERDLLRQAENRVGLRSHALSNFIERLS